MPNNIDHVELHPAANGWLLTLYYEEYKATYVFVRLDEALNFIRIRLTGE